MLAEEAPKITDWIQAWGSLGGLIMSVLAVIATWGLLRHEIRVRREERLDAELAQARLVVPTLTEVGPAEPWRGGKPRATYKVVNYSSSPVLDVTVRHRWEEGSLGLPHHFPVLTGEEKGDLQLFEGMQPAMLTKVVRTSQIEIMFTDSNGHRWSRLDRHPPVRVLDKPVRDSRTAQVVMIVLSGTMAAGMAGAAVSLIVR
ncbi:hypothetical protein [Micromonospora haikouensis]|uniref:Uncharacterized protein n=1 Tax=Micromonospora haikouensis TaxID=686309 RepID=A0A0D0X1F1_9ACTN|nr:hypothetical protein [Micromonospora haikouensis]KIR64744.1 hypothetical protein TK50_03755 [Micromonospora haikouensis]